MSGEQDWDDPQPSATWAQGIYITPAMTPARFHTDQARDDPRNLKVLGAINISQLSAGKTEGKRSRRLWAQWRDLRVVRNNLMWVASDNTWGNSGILDCAVTRTNISIHCPAAAGTYLLPGRCPWFGLLLWEMLMSEGCVQLAPSLTWACGHGGWARELTLPLTSCSTQESGSCTLPEQHNTANPDGRGVSMKAGPTTCLLCWSMGKGEMPSQIFVPCHL